MSLKGAVSHKGECIDNIFAAYFSDTILHTTSKYSECFSSLLSVLKMGKMAVFTYCLIYHSTNIIILGSCQGD